MNLLISCVGRRVQLIDCFKKEFNSVGGKVVTICNEPTAPAIYHSDIFEIVPGIDHPQYISIMKGICHKYKIDAILPIIEPELSKMAQLKEEFEKEGIKVIISDEEIIDLCSDKYSTYKFLKENNLPYIPSYIDIEDVIKDINDGKLKFPLMIKPRNGFGSRGIKKILDIIELQNYWSENSNLMVQPFINEDEYCVECYVDMVNHKITNLFSKRKISERRGTTDIAVAVKDSELYNLTEKLISVLKPIGPIDIDLFKTEKGYVITEINPRFGDGYPYAYEMGQNFIKSIITNIKNEPNEPIVKFKGAYEEGATMVRYDHFAILETQSFV